MSEAHHFSTLKEANIIAQRSKLPLRVQRCHKYFEPTALKYGVRYAAGTDGFQQTFDGYLVGADFYKDLAVVRINAPKVCSRLNVGWRKKDIFAHIFASQFVFNKVFFSGVPKDMIQNNDM